MKRLTFVFLSIISFNFIFAAGGTIPAGLPTVFGFGAIDKSDTYAASSPHFYKGTTAGTCWDYSYAYLTSDFSASGYNTWTGWVAGGQWAANELKYWEARGQIQVFSFYYTPYNLSNYNDNTKMNQYYKDFKLLCQVIAANSTKKVIIHLEPDLLGFWRKAGRSATSTGAVKVGSAGFGETCDGVAINSLPDTIQGWSEALYRIRNQYGAGKVLLAHHYTHWGNASSKDVLVDTSLSQNDVNTHVDDTTTFLTQVENGKKYDLIFVDPSDRDADWFRIKGGQGNTRWTGSDHSGFTSARTWGKLGYVFDRVSTNMGRKLMFWQIPVGNTYYKTCNNTDYHYRDNSAQEFIPSTSSDGSSGTPGDAYSPSSTTTGPGYWASKGFIGVLFGEGGYDQYQTDFNTVTHLRDWPNDGVTNPGSDASPNGAVSFDVWGKATSTDADNEGGYVRKAVAAYCSKGKYSLSGTANTPTYTNTATNTATRTNTPIPPTSTYTYTNTATNTPTRTNTAIPPTNTNTAVPSTNTFTNTNTATNTPTRTNTAIPPTNTNTAVPPTNTNTAIPPTNTYTNTNTATKTPTRTFTAVPPTNTNTTVPSSTNTAIPGSTNTHTFTNTPTYTATRTFTAIPPTNTNTTIPSSTNTPLPGSTNTYTFTITNTHTATHTPTNTPLALGVAINYMIPSGTVTLGSTSVIQFNYAIANQQADTVMIMLMQGGLPVKTLAAEMTPKVPGNYNAELNVANIFNGVATGSYTIMASVSNTALSQSDSVQSAAFSFVNNPTSTATVPPASTATHTFTNTHTPTSTSTNTAIAVNTATYTNTVPAITTATYTPTEIATPAATESMDPKITDLFVYPNPYTAGKLKIKCKISKRTRGVSFKLYSASFRLLKEYNNTNPQMNGEVIVEVPEQNFKKLSNGTYYYMLSAETEAGSKIKSKADKFIIMK